MASIYAAFTDAEIEIIAQVKRVFERLRGDGDFRQAAAEGRIMGTDRLAWIGSDLEPEALAPVWEKLQDSSTAQLNNADFDAYPALDLWRRKRIASGKTLGRLQRDENAVADERFEMWRKRQISKGKSETVVLHRVKYLPAFAFELSKGCSMGCWFCGLAAPPFETYLPYTDANRELWRSVLTASRETFSINVLTLPLCYHGTEPFDNPDYFKFMDDVIDICGVLPQTTTAAPLRDLDMTRRMIARRENHPDIWDRFSILSGTILKRVHKTFTPRELLNVELECQNTDGFFVKAAIGRARESRDRLAESNRAGYLNAGMDPDKEREACDALAPDTISCVCGYLVNMVERKVQLVAPCRVSDENPSGYRVYAESIFQTGTEFRAFLDHCAAEFMPLKPDWADTIRFREDLKYNQRREGYTLTSISHRHTMRGKPWHREIGDAIVQGKSTWGQLVTRLAAKGVVPGEVEKMLQNLFDRGMLKED